MKNPARKIVILVLSFIFAAAGLILISGWFDSNISRAIEVLVSKSASINWPGYYRLLGGALLITGIGLLLYRPIYNGIKKAGGYSLSAFHTLDNWLEKNLSGLVNLSTLVDSGPLLKFEITDYLAIIIFIFLALIFQLSRSSHGFPTVILGGDAANIASFAAGRAFPLLFGNDAILGDIRNIGLYVTIHLPITIWLEKLVGNFGLAYSVLLFPHVLLQYVSYYLLGRVIFQNRYWAFLFTLTVSSPLALAGGELWGVVGDAMPRFTFQVLIPIILILLLTIWRDLPQRWPWVMVIAGLLAFIHPVSTPSWAFALWLGFWPSMPKNYEFRRKSWEMIKLGLVLVLALLPYVAIYLTYHQGGRSNINYDLVYMILTNYFPENLLNIPAAVRTLISVTSQFGLLWYGLIGLVFTFLYFRSERRALKLMLTWMAGIAFVTILVPFVEQTIERALRIIPLQTELMRGMRYLVPFLFILWFYPFSQLTQRGLRLWIVRLSFAIGTISALSWLVVNPPLPVIEAPGVIQCWSQGRFICPTDTDYADAFKYIRENTPEKATFTVFLTNRWSGIEVRYLGLRPMVYAYKDRGQLTFTNLDALQTWYYFLRRENAIYSRNVSPTLALQQERMIDFAFDAKANYLLTDFPFPPEIRAKYNVRSVYQNGTFTILKTYPYIK